MRKEDSYQYLDLAAMTRKVMTKVANGYDESKTINPKKETVVNNNHKYEAMYYFAYWDKNIWISIRRLMKEDDLCSQKDFLAYTFRLIQKQNKIVYSSNRSFAVINTGLISKYDDDIYMVFVPNDKHESPWKSYAVCCQSEDNGCLLSRFSSLPLRATFEDYYDDMNYNINLGTPFISQRSIEHMSDLDHMKRARWIGSKELFINKLLDSFNMTMKYVRRCPRLAVPIYYPKHDRVCLAIPIAIHSDDIKKPDVAMVIRLNDSVTGYEGVTIIPLCWAYDDSRLIEIPESCWLTIENARRANIL